MGNGSSQFSHRLRAGNLSKFVLRLLQRLLGTPSVLNVGSCSIPFNNFSQLVAQRHSAMHEPAICPVCPPHSRLFLERLPGRKGCPPFFLCAIFGMKCLPHPAPSQSFFHRETRVFPETLIQEISRAIGQFAPHQRRECVNDQPQAVFGFFSIFYVGIRTLPSDVRSFT